MDLSFEIGRLFADPRTPPEGPFYIVVGVVVAVWLLASIVLQVLAPRLIHDNQPLLALVRTTLTAFIIIAAFGVVFVPLRYAAVPLFSKPLWLALTALAGVITVAWAIWYALVRYPRQLAEYREERYRRRWLPKPKSARSGRRAERRRA